MMTDAERLQETVKEQRTMLEKMVAKMIGVEMKCRLEMTISRIEEGMNLLTGAIYGFLELDKLEGRIKFEKMPIPAGSKGEIVIADNLTGLKITFWKTNISADD